MWTPVLSSGNPVTEHFKEEVSKMKTNLTDLANKYGSDKGTTAGSISHKYSYMYDLILDKYTVHPVNFLELGLAIGGPELGGSIDRQVTSPSIQMWLEYFPWAHIYGFDISDFSHMRHDRFTFIRGDGGNEADFVRLGKSAPSFDVIIDDASHASLHQQLALKHLFPHLSDNGTYIIEDLHWQAPVYEVDTPEIPKTAQFLIEFFVHGKYIENKILSRDFMNSIRNRIRSYAWFPAFDGSSAVPKIFVLRN
jgi:hypothetical protein